MPQQPERPDAALVTVPGAPRRAARMVAYGNAALGGHVSPDLAAERIVAGDLVHRVVGLPGDETTPVSVPWLLVRLRGLGVSALRLVLPVPGDPAGLPGPPDFNADAVEAREAVVAVGRPVALLPRAVGSAVEWSVRTVARDGSAAQTLSLAEADRMLREALLSATEALQSLDVARWRPGLAEDLEQRRRAGGEDVLAPGYPSRAAAVVTLARRVGAVVALAAEESGAAVTAREAEARSRTLRELAQVCRRVEVAAYNAL